MSAAAWDRLEVAREQARLLLEGRTMWWINSTAWGGGVAEMQRTLLPYWRGSGVDTRWLVVEGPPVFFRLTKRIHNLLHGVPVRRPDLGDQALFQHVSRALAAAAVDAVAPGDVVVLQDPQTAGLAPALKRSGAIVVWRCHIGVDRLSEPVEDAWSFLLPYIEAADAFIFSRREYVPPALDPARAKRLTPAIDPRSAKNQALSAPLAQAILSSCGLAQAPTPRQLTTVAVPGGVVRLRRRARVWREGPLPRLGTDRLVVALARWDRLKDPSGTIRAFAEHVTATEARLIVAGPATWAVADDPEGSLVFAEACAAWESVPKAARRRIQLACLPMGDLDENALIANALQRQAAVIVKKSLQEGFGLGVTEGMWQARPVVATRVGGHQDQIQHDRTGLLVDDPHDLGACGAAITQLLENPAKANELATAGREHAREHFLADRHLVSWMQQLDAVMSWAGTTD